MAYKTARTLVLIGIMSVPCFAHAMSIWPATSVPAIVDWRGSDPFSAVELGVKFHSDVPGVITGVRFYKAAANTGPHTGSLWSSTGERLAQATFGDETTEGWQQVNFDSPVAIAANTVYVASYFDPHLHYSATHYYFASQGADNPPLHALADGVSGGNGVYTYSATSMFPTETYQTLNYWVDVVFTSGCSGDCNGDGEVTIEELITMVNIALGNVEVPACIAADTNHDGEVTIEESIEAVGRALDACSSDE